MPKGYEFLDAASTDSYEGIVITGIYSSTDDGEIILSYVISAHNASALYPKDNDDPNVYEKCGVKHYLIFNEGQWGAVWEADNIVCQINGVNEKTELIKMIDSIYERK